MKKPTKAFLVSEVKRLTKENEDLHKIAFSNTPAISKNPKIEELEALLKNDEDVPITILPNGEIRAYTDSEMLNKKLEKMKPITMKEDLGGEYSSQELILAGGV